MSSVNALPLYVQIAELLIREIMAGRLVPGERLAPEREMAAELGTSVGTLRKALAELTAKGLVERRQGSGNYVAAAPDPVGVYALFRLELLEGGGLPTADILSVDTLPKPSTLPDIGESEIGHCIRRLRRLNGVPAALEEIWLDGRFVQFVTTADLSDSMYLFYKERLNLWIARAEDRVRQGAVPRWSTVDFAPRPGTTVPLIERIAWGQDGATAEASYTWYDPDVAAYVARIT